jgi:3',5'-cyclic AMP phosphodiesterase CpdA
MVMYSFFRIKGSIQIVIILLLALCVTGCPLFWIKKDRNMPDIANVSQWDGVNPNDRRTIIEKNDSLEKYYISHFGTRKEKKFTAKAIKMDESVLITRTEADNVVKPLSQISSNETKLTFVHLSDVQLRDEQVRFYDPKTSKKLDKIIPTFEKTPYHEAFDGAAYYAIIQSINETVENNNFHDHRCPKFMIHTGDAIDAGVVNELYEFLYITNELKIPWYNVIGNHDIGTFGNIKPSNIYVNDPFIDFMTIHDPLNFINMHHNAYEYNYAANRSPINTDMDATLDAGSKYNGFDRNYSISEINEYSFVCEDCPGYYSLEVKKEDPTTKDPTIRIVVLNTKIRFGSGGKIDDEQFKWLESKLEEHTNDIVLVFGHHQLSGLGKLKNSKKLENLLCKYPNVVAYFCGHTHEHDINYHQKKDGSFGFWEIVAGAICTFPKQGSLVQIKYENGHGYIDIYAFDHTIQPKYKDEHGNVLPSELYEHTQYAFKGAKEDASEKKKKINEGDRNARLKFPYFFIK